MPAISLDGRSLTLQQLANDARKAHSFTLDADAHLRLGESARQVAAAAQGDAAVYGINTGFGAFANRRIERSAVMRDQKLLAVPAGDNVVRLIPALTVTDADIREGLNRIRAGAAAVSASLAVPAK